MRVFALTTLFLLIVVQVFWLFRVGDVVRRRFRPPMSGRSRAARELAAALMFVAMTVLVFGVYLFGPAFVMVQVFASALSTSPADLGKFVPVFVFIGFFILGTCVKLWPKRFAWCGLTTGSTPTRRKRRAG